MESYSFKKREGFHMKYHAKQTRKTVSIILLLCIIFSSFPSLAYTNFESSDGYVQQSAHEAALNSLTNQLNSKGIGLYSIMSEDNVISPSGFDFGTKVSYEINEPLIINDSNEITTVITFKLSSPNDREVSFDYKVYPGSAFLYTHYEGVENGSIVFPAEQTEISIEIKINNNYEKDSPLASNHGEIWSGEKVFYISCFNINNALFESDREVMTVPVRIENALNLKQIYENAANVFMADISQIQNAESVLDTEGKYVNTGAVINIASASAITADVRKMIDIGTFSHLNLPIGYFLNELGATGEVSLQIVKNYASSSNYDFNMNTSIDAAEEIIDFGFNDASLGDLYMGRNNEANGAVKSLDISLNYDITDNDTVYTVFHDEDGNYVQYQMNFEDKIKPEPIGSEAPTGVYCLGENIPITVTFNEAVLTDDISIKANGTVLYPVERKGTISEDVSFLYEICPDFDNLIDIQDVTGAVDLSGKEQDDSMTYNNQITVVELKSYSTEELLSYCADTEIVVNQGKSMNAEVDIILSLKENVELSDYLSEHKAEDGRIKTIKAVVIGENGSSYDVELYTEDEYSITQLKGKFTAPSSSEISDTNYIAEIYFDENEINNFELIYSLSKQYTLPQIIYIDNESDLEILYENWPAENKISSGSVEPISLGYNIKNNATWQEPDDLVWASSDNTIASITTSGAILLTGIPGSVNFYLTALNPGQAEKEFTIYSNALQVIDTGEVFLNISSWSENIEIIEGNDAKIYYSTNISANNEAATTFHYDLFEAEYEADEITKGKLIANDTKFFTAETQEFNYTVDRQYLNNISERGKYSYILEISARDEKTDMMFTISAYIRVKSLPAKAVLSKPDSFYIIDEAENFNVKFDVDNYNDNTEVMLTVVKNGDTVIAKNSITDRNKDISVPIIEVDDDNLYDIYMVSLRAKNDFDETYSYDSYTMYVYNSDALKISVNGENKESHTMSMDDILGHMSSEDILALNREIFLRDNISINNSDYNWSRLYDKITWSVEDENILSLKYKNGGLLSNIDDNVLISPNAQLFLEGLSAGKSYITVKHNLTGMEKEIEVTVDNLKGKLFLFQVFPAQKSEVTYTDGDNNYKIRKTDEDGRIAIFEKSGIKGNIEFRPENNAAYDTFILSSSELSSMQQVSNYSGLYPQNNIVFKTAEYETTFDVRLIDEGRYSSYEGGVIIKGGVYRNGVYCPGATINGNNGQQEQSVEKTGSRYILTFNKDEFVNNEYKEPITSEDKIEYIFEVSVPDDSYYSKFVKVENQTIRYFKTFYNAPAPAGTAYLESRNSSRIENDISIASQKFILGGNESDVPESIIIEDLSKSAYIKTDIAFKGNPASRYDIKFLDKKDNMLIDSSNTEVESNEFSDTILIKNTFDILKYVSTLDLGEVRNLNMLITVKGADGLELINLTTNYRVSRINDISEISSLETGGLKKLGQDVRDSIKGSSLIDTDGKADYIKTSLNYISGFSVDSDKLRLEITPTDNPLVFKGVIMMGVGELSRYMKSGVYSGDEKASMLYDYIPSYETYDRDFIKDSEIYMDAYMGGYGSNNKVYGGGAYFDCEIFYDINDEEWKIIVLKSFVHIGGGYHYQKIYNTWIGPVPVTAEFLAGGAGQLNLKSASDGIDKGTTYITELQPYIYIRGFGGVGRDYKIVSLKAGVYGKVSLDQQYLWLKSENKNINGQKITLAGETGIEYEIKLVLINVEGTYKIGEGSKSWTFNDYNNIRKQYELMGLRSVGFNLNDETDNRKATFEDRSYLAHERSWNSFMARRAFAGGTNIIQTNAYPYSNPVLSTDGEMMVYISDMDSTELNETSACFSLKSDGVFPEGTPINSSDYADLDAVIDGTADNAAVAWTRVITDMELSPGSKATNEDILHMMSGTEIMAGIYDGSKFITTRLTENSMADMSPVVAANGNKAIVAWRSFDAGVDSGSEDETESHLSIENRDNIMYRIYNGSEWSEEKYLYDGSIDNINSYNIKMLSNGTSAVTYEVTIGNTDNTEIYCAIIDKDGSILNNIRLTNSEEGDETPQITSVEFPDSEERFVIAWNSVTETGIDEIKGKSVIRIAAIDENGNIYSHLEAEIESSDTVDYSGFKFPKGSEKLEDLSIVWAQAEFDSEGNYSHSLWGRRFLYKDESFIVSPEIKLLELDKKISIDFYDSHVDNTEKINFMLQTTDYNTDQRLSNIIYGQAEYSNILSLEQIYYTHNDILPGNKMPFMFRLYNKGIEPIDNVSIEFGGIIHKFADSDYIIPGQYKDINILYTVPETIVDPEYSITAEYPSSSDKVTGTIKLNIPDVGIYSIDVVKEAQRERILSIMLHNNTYSKLTEGKHIIKLYAYDSPDSEAMPIASAIISDADSFNMINSGMYSKNILLNEEALQGILNEEGEIPDNGVRIFINAVIEENGEEIEDFDLSNDWDYITIKSLISKNMERVTLVSRMNSAQAASVQVQFTNNSMNELKGGNIVVSLKNESGSIIETKQFGGKNSLTVGGEETFATIFDFNSGGASFDAAYIPYKPDDGKDTSDKPKDAKKPKDYINPFKDVNDTDWFYDAVNFVLENELMIGTSTDAFEPELLVTRGMLVTILHRLETLPAAASGNFTDVEQGDYYYDAVAWAQQNGIVLGINQSLFGPNESITREQFAAILYRYYLYKNNGVIDIGADLSGYEDSGMISNYALPALQWAVGKGLIQGRGEDTLAPRGNATRAETAVILQRFLEGNI